MSLSFNNFQSQLRSSLIIGFLCLGFSSRSAVTVQKSPEFFIVDSYLIGWVSGFATGKGARWKTANQTACRKAKFDAKIWGGLFVTDSNKTTIRKTGEICSRFLYETPQTLAGFSTAQFYNTFTNRVWKVEYELGATSLKMNVDWPGVCLGSYILADTRIEAKINNKLFQHEYGHYLQSQRLGWSYLVRIGLPAIMSKGDHDKHPVEVGCNAEACLYFHNYYKEFEENGNYTDTIGWNYRFNPLPDTIGQKVKYRLDSLVVIDFNNSEHLHQLDALIVRGKFFDYSSWIVPFVGPTIRGFYLARRYNKEQSEVQGFEL